jgi:hypothetical protein
MPTSSAAIKKIEGIWTGVTTAAVPPDGAPFFAPYLSDGRCDPRYSMGRAPATNAEVCATRCVGTPDCAFYSFCPPSATTNGTSDCALFSFCVVESATNYTTRRAVNLKDQIAATCRAEMSIMGLAITIAIHSCSGAAASAPAARRSAQTGELRGVLLSAGKAGEDCDALQGAGASPCTAMQLRPGLPGQPYELWRLRVRWTYSSRDRVVGDVDTICFATGLSDGKDKWPLQLSLIPATVEPDFSAAFEQDGGSAEAVAPSPRGAWRLRLRLATAPAKPVGMELAAIGLLAAADECRKALDTTLGLASSSSDCAAAVSAVLPDAATSSGGDRAARATSACGSVCRPMLSAAVDEAALRCATAWSTAPLQVAVAEQPGVDGSPVLLARTAGLSNLLSDLIRAADAAYLLAVACSFSRSGTYCAASEDIISGCPSVTPPGSALGNVVQRTFFRPSPPSSGNTDTGSRLCDGNCTMNLANYLFKQGCCVATVEEAKALWINRVCRPSIGTKFWVDWGDGTELELFRAADACPKPVPLGAGTAAAAAANAAAAVASVTLECRAGQCGLGVMSGVWPTACCDDSMCSNGGVKVVIPAAFKALCMLASIR